MTFNWVQTDDLATIYYEVSNGTISCNGSVDTTGYVVGNTYGEDLTQYLSSFGISNVTITISKIDVTTSKGAMAVNLKTPFTAKVHMAYGSGSGTKNNPFIISCSRHFMNIELNISRYTYFIITKHIYLHGNGIEEFYGNLNSTGTGASIYWWATSKQDTGVILHNYGNIRNIVVFQESVIDVSSLYNYCVGGLVSVNESGGLIENCNICSFKGI